VAAPLLKEAPPTGNEVVSAVAHVRHMPQPRHTSKSTPVSEMDSETSRALGGGQVDIQLRTRSWQYLHGRKVQGAGSGHWSLIF
jgi:hypothetical protein